MHYKRIVETAERVAIFERMQDEGLISLAMSAYKNPTLGDWLDVTAIEKCVFLGCYNDDDTLMGCATFTRFRGLVYEFDFTAFRDFFYTAVEQAKGGFAWMFRHTDAKSIIGICPVTNRHALALAHACGFVEMGRLHKACYVARIGRYVDGVLLQVAEKRPYAASVGVF